MNCYFLIIAYSLFAQTSELDLEKVVIYGKREISLKTIKEDLIPDTVDVFPELKKYNIELERSIYKETFFSPKSLLNISGAIGHSGDLAVFYGKNNYYAKLFYFNKVNRPDNELGLSGGVIYKDFLSNVEADLLYYRDNYYHSDREYKKFTYNIGYTKSPYFSSFCEVLFANLELTGVWPLISTKEQGWEKVITFKSSLLYPFESISSLTSLEFKWDELAWDEKWLGSVIEALSFNFNKFFVKPGIKLYSQSPFIAPYLGMKYYPFSLEYTQKISLRTRDKNLQDNPYILNDFLRIWNYGNCFTLGIDFNKCKLEGGWIEKYPEFSHIGICTTSVSWVSFSWKFPYVNFYTRYNFSRPFYTPSFEFALDFYYKKFSSGIEYQNYYVNKEDYSFLSIRVMHSFPRGITAFVKGNNLFYKENEAEIFKGHPERGRGFYVGAGVKI